MGSQSLLRAVLEAELGRGNGGRFIKECKEAVMNRPEIRDEKVAERLWSFSEKQITILEKQSALKRAAAKQEELRKEKKTKEPLASSTTSISDESGTQRKGSRKASKPK